MNRKKFGRLVAKLRIERHDHNGKSWTQSNLAERANTSSHIIGRIERGEKVLLDPGALTLMANAFNLNTRQRLEFFQAALGIEECDLPHPSLTAEKILQEVTGVLEGISLPGFVVDSYDNAVLVNARMLALFDFITDLRRIAPERVAGYNILRFVFSEESRFYELLDGNSAPYLRQSIHFFKTISFRNRATRFYAQMMDAFATEPAMRRFGEYFSQPKNEGGEYVYESSPATLRHPQFGELKFFSPATSNISTPFGSLYLITYLPASPHTLQVFAGLPVEENSVEQYADWPIPADEWDDDEILDDEILNEEEEENV
jgi:transcriptional regulator with XRE-family HTH domain